VRLLLQASSVIVNAVKYWGLKESEIITSTSLFLLFIPFFSALYVSLIRRGRYSEYEILNNK
jgi:hypothetical protein